MRRSRNRARTHALAGRTVPAVLLCLGAAWALLGCQAPPEPKTPAPELKPSVQLDPCAENLHDMSGRLLLYYGFRGRLPLDLAELKALKIGPPQKLTCPVSGQPYVYRPAGVPIAGHPGRAVFFDAQPCHSGMRWAILFIEGATSGTPETRVLLLPNEPFVAGSAPSRPQP